jgi:hypothetical protein
MIYSCSIHTALIVGTTIVAAGMLLYAIERWHKECGRREQRHLREAVEGEARP